MQNNTNYTFNYRIPVSIFRYPTIFHNLPGVFFDIST